jgi:D-serine dehydratase
MPTPSEIDAERLDPSFKGFPPECPPFLVAQAGAQRLHLLDGSLPMPVAVLRESALRHNARWLMGFVADTGASLAPHGKTTNAPQLFAEQLREGAWGITVANVHQGRLAVEAGAPRVLMANQLATEADARRWGALARSHPSVRLLTLVDSAAQLAVLARGLAAAGAPRLDVLVELGTPGGRTGCRSVGEALALARAVAIEPAVRLAGVEAFEGLGVVDDDARDGALVGAWMRGLGELARACDREGLFDGLDEALLSAGGSAAYDLVVRGLREAGLSRPSRIVLRSGCYLSHDDGMYRRHAAAIAARGLEPSLRGVPPVGALEVWAAVQSRPEPDRAIVTLGRRDVGTDADLALPKWMYRRGRDAAPWAAPDHWRVFGHNDQHGYLRVDPADDLAVGDLVGFGVSHPCTTFDKWRLVWAIDDDGRVTRAIRTYF